MRKWTVLAIGLALFAVTGCAENNAPAPPAGTVEPSEAQATQSVPDLPKETPQLIVDKAPASGAADISADVEASASTAVTETPPSSIASTEGKEANFAKERYSVFNLNEEDELVLELAQDLDGDGEIEYIVGFGERFEEYDAAEFTQIYVLREQDGQLIRQGGNLAQSGYYVYGVDLVRLQGRDSYCIRLYLTNGGSLTGFALAELQADGPARILESASPTGAGEDRLTDADQDGFYDGYEQRRWSYDVYGYPVSYFYTLANDGFALSEMHIGFGDDKPVEAKDVVLEYLIVRALDRGVAFPEGDERLSWLCVDGELTTVELPMSEVYAGLSEIYWNFEESFDFEVREKQGTAVVTVSTPAESESTALLAFDMLHSDGRWRIAGIESL